MIGSLNKRVQARKACHQPIGKRCPYSLSRCNFAPAIIADAKARIEFLIGTTIQV